VSKGSIGQRLLCSLGCVAGMMCTAVRADDCVTAAPTPMFSTARHDIEAHRFVRKSGHEAVERFRLGTDTQVRVAHGGCEYVVARFRFASPGLFADRYADALAYEQAAALLGRLRALRPARDFDFDLGLARKTLLGAAQAAAGVGRGIACAGRRRRAARGGVAGGGGRPARGGRVRRRDAVQRAAVGAPVCSHAR